MLISSVQSISIGNLTELAENHNTKKENQGLDSKSLVRVLMRSRLLVYGYIQLDSNLLNTQSAFTFVRFANLTTSTV